MLGGTGQPTYHPHHRTDNRGKIWSLNDFDIGRKLGRGKFGAWARKNRGLLTLDRFLSVDPVERLFVARCPYLPLVTNPGTEPPNRGGVPGAGEADALHRRHQGALSNAQQLDNPILNSHPNPSPTPPPVPENRCWRSASSSAPPSSTSCGARSRSRPTSGVYACFFPFAVHLLNYQVRPVVLTHVPP